MTRITKTKITAFSTGGATTFIVWYQCPLSKIFQTISSHDTTKEAKAAAKEIRINGVA